MSRFGGPEQRLPIAVRCGLNQAPDGDFLPSMAPDAPGPCSASSPDAPVRAARGASRSSDDARYMGIRRSENLPRRLWVAAPLTLGVVYLSMGGWLPAALRPETWVPHGLNGWLQCLLTAPVFLWSGAPFIRRWAVSIVERDTNMFTLTVTGTGAAFGFSVLALLWPDLIPLAMRAVLFRSGGGDHDDRPRGASGGAAQLRKDRGRGSGAVGSFAAAGAARDGRG